MSRRWALRVLLVLVCILLLLSSSSLRTQRVMQEVNMLNNVARRRGGLGDTVAATESLPEAQPRTSEPPSTDLKSEGTSTKGLQAAQVLDNYNPKPGQVNGDWSNESVTVISIEDLASDIKTRFSKLKFRNVKYLVLEIQGSRKISFLDHVWNLNVESQNVLLVTNISRLSANQLPELFNTFNNSRNVVGTFGITYDISSLHIPSASRTEKRIPIKNTQSQSQDVDILNGVWLMPTKYFYAFGKYQITSSLDLSFHLWRDHGARSVVIPGGSVQAEVGDESMRRQALDGYPFVDLSNQGGNNDLVSIVIRATDLTKDVISFIEAFKQANKTIAPIIIGTKQSFQCAVFSEMRLMTVDDCEDFIPHTMTFAENAQHAERILNWMMPVVVFNFLGVVVDAGEGVAQIQMNPTSVLNDIAWIPKLSIHSLSNWHIPRINLILFTNNRQESFRRLLKSLSTANYLNDIVSLKIFIDNRGQEDTLNLSSSFPWPHGPKAIQHKVARDGLFNTITGSWWPTSNDDYAVFLEDDIEVSPFFYSWLKWTLLKYRYGNEKEQSTQMFGISLYTPKAIEVTVPRRSFKPTESLPSTTPPNSPFLLQLPCSWGALYFPEFWREYHNYLHDRMPLDQNSKYNATIPGSRSNTWRRSWKRFFIELIYFRGYTMLYPNFINATSFSTNHMEAGDHVKAKHIGNDRLEAMYVVSLIGAKDNILDQLPSSTLSEFPTLPILDLWHKHVSNLKDLVRRGQEATLNPTECRIVNGLILRNPDKSPNCQLKSNIKKR